MCATRKSHCMLSLIQKCTDWIAPVYIGKPTTVFPEVQQHALPGEPLYTFTGIFALLPEVRRYTFAIAYTKTSHTHTHKTRRKCLGMFGADCLRFLLVVLYVSCQLSERWNLLVKFLLWFQQWMSVLERPVNSSRNVQSSRKRWANRTLCLGCVYFRDNKRCFKKRRRWSEICSP